MRYQVVEGSQSGHCCFEFTVVDTSSKRGLYREDDQHEAVCECWEEEIAQKIAAALNAQEEKQ